MSNLATSECLPGTLQSLTLSCSEGAPLFSFSSNLRDIHSCQNTKPALSDAVITQLELIGGYLKRVSSAVIDTLTDLALISGEARGWLELRANEASLEELKLARAIYCQKILENVEERAVLSKPFNAQRVRESLSFCIDDTTITRLSQPDRDLDLSDLLLTLGCLSSDSSWQKIFKQSLAVDIAANFNLSTNLGDGAQQKFAREIIELAKEAPHADEEVFAMQGVLSGLSRYAEGFFHVDPGLDTLLDQHQKAEKFLENIFERRHAIRELNSDLSLFLAKLRPSELPEAITQSEEYRLAIFRASFSRQLPRNEEALLKQVQVTLSDLVSSKDLEVLFSHSIIEIALVVSNLDSIANTQEGIQSLFQGLLQQLTTHTENLTDGISALAQAGQSGASWASCLSAMMDSTSSAEQALRTPKITTPLEFQNENLHNAEKKELPEASGRRPDQETPPGLLVRLSDLHEAYKAQRQFTSPLQRWSQIVGKNKLASHLPAEDFLPLLSTLAETISESIAGNKLTEAVRRSLLIDLGLAREALIHLIGNAPSGIPRLNDPDFRVPGWTQTSYKGSDLWVYKSGKTLSASGPEVSSSLIRSSPHHRELALAFVESLKRKMDEHGAPLSTYLEFDKNPSEKFLQIAWAANLEDCLKRVEPDTICMRTLLTIAHENQDSQPYFFDLLANPQELAVALLHGVIRPSIALHGTRINEAGALLRIFDSLRREVMTINSSPSSHLQECASKILSLEFVNKIQDLLDNLRSGSFFREQDGGRYLQHYLKLTPRSGSLNQKSLPTLSSQKLPPANSVSGLQFRLARACTKGKGEKLELESLREEMNNALRTGLLAQLPGEHLTRAFIAKLSNPDEITRLEIEELLVALAQGTGFGVVDLPSLRGQAEDGTPVYLEPKSCIHSPTGNSDALSIVLHSYNQSLRMSAVPDYQGSLERIVSQAVTGQMTFENKLPPSRMLPFEALLSLAILLERKNNPEQISSLALGILRMGIQHPDYTRELAHCFDNSIQYPEKSKIQAQLEQMMPVEQARKVSSHFLESLAQIGLSNKFANNLIENTLSCNLLLYWSKSNVLPTELSANIQAELAEARALSPTELIDLLQSEFLSVINNNNDDV